MEKTRAADQKCVVIGGGIIGASIAYHLAKAGLKVAIVDQSVPASQASGASFGWVNASFYADAHHHRIRAASIDATRVLAREIGSDAIEWPGALWWETQGAEFDAFCQGLRAQEYDHEVVSIDEFSKIAPLVGNPPERAVLLRQEAAMDVARFTSDLICAAQRLGVVVHRGTRVEEFEETGSSIKGLRCNVGKIACDRVVVAAGCGTEALLAGISLRLPMLQRPGGIVTTKPVAQDIGHILVAPNGEFRQEKSGRILAPTAISHQSDDTSELTGDIETSVNETIERINGLLPAAHAEFQSVAFANRPVPKDGLPAIGPIGPAGLYVATMHSGATLAAICGTLVAKEIATGERDDLLIPYDPERFGQAETGSENA